MCSANSLALAIKVCRNSKTDKKSDQDFYIDWTWHKRTNCLSLKMHRKNWKDLKPNSFETDCHWMAIVGKNSALKWNDTSFGKNCKKNLNSLCLGLNFIEWKMSQHSLWKFLDTKYFWILHLKWVECSNSLY